MSYEQSTSAFVLGGVNAAVDDTLRNYGYEPVRCDPRRQRSSEVFRALREAGLMVVDFSVQDPVSDQLYAAAHGRGLPAIRMQVTASADQELPWILRGDAGGYQNDIVRGAQPDDLAAQVEPRVKAMFRLSPALRDGSGSEYLQARRYAQFFVFISHTLKPPERALVNQIYSLLRQRHVTPFEYHEVNAAGIDWRVALKDSLHKTTHFVALLSPDYEQSQTCTYELEEILVRKEQVSILPFMVLGRSAPNPKLTQIHNRLLADPDPLVNAQTVVQEVMAALDADLARIASS
jgi:signal transduction histidine kinase